MLPFRLRPPKQWFYLPALFVLGFIIMLQRRRRSDLISDLAQP